MSRDELIAKAEKRGVAILAPLEFHKMFPGPPLAEVEFQFKMELFKAGFNRAPPLFGRCNRR